MPPPTGTQPVAQANPRYWRSVEQDPSLMAQLALIPHGSRVLEIGPAAGHMTRALLDRGSEVTAVEADPELAALASRFCKKLVVGNIEQLDLGTAFASERFDVVLLGDVLEHLVGPGPVLRALRPVLAPAGFLVVSMPNVSHGDVRLALLQGRFEYQPQGLLDVAHLRFFTLVSIQELFRGADYEIHDLTRIRRPLLTAEVPMDPSILSLTVLKQLCRDPEAETLQFVFRAIPVATPPTPTNGPGHPTSSATRTPDQARRDLAAEYSRQAWSLLWRDPADVRRARRMYYRSFRLHPGPGVLVRACTALLPSRALAFLRQRMSRGPQARSLSDD